MSDRAFTRTTEIWSGTGREIANMELLGAGLLEPEAADFRYGCGGGGGIRTHERLAPLTVFKTVAFDRSATPPRYDFSRFLLSEMSTCPPFVHLILRRAARPGAQRPPAEAPAAREHTS
jgi:hypothetical protein